jgi:hypothetical protein
MDVLFVGRYLTPTGCLLSAAVLLIEAPVIRLHLHDLAPAPGGNADLTAIYPPLLLSAVSMAMMARTTFGRTTRHGRIGWRAIPRAAVW